MSLFNAKEWQRYQRHVQLNGFGASGQVALKQAHVLIIGAGGLGCPAAQYLGAAGIGQITIVDADTISASNLQRQILFGEADVGHAKVDISKQRLLANNPHINVTAINEHLHSGNATQLITAADIVLDCTDNFQTRYLINDTCLRTKTTWVYASVIQFSGQVALFQPNGACFRCLFPHAPDDIQDCNSAGVLGVMPGLLATLQVNEAIKYLSGIDVALANTLMLVEGITANFTKINLSKDKQCVCNQPSAIPLVPPTDTICNAAAHNPCDIAPEEFKRLSQQPTAVIDVRSLAEHQAFNIGGLNIELDDRFSSHFNDKDSPYLLYCQSGTRSEKAALELQNHGFTNVRCLAGGLSAWLQYHL